VLRRGRRTGAGPRVNGARGAGRVLAAREEGEGREEKKRGKKKKGKEKEKEKEKGREERKKKKEKGKGRKIGEEILENLENC
jgi:hypothetical protein